MRAGKLRRKRVPKAPVLKDERVVQKMYRMRAGKGGKGPWEHRVWRGDLKGTNKWYCVHNRQKNSCRACGGVSICHHDRIRSRCKVQHPLEPRCWFVTIACSDGCATYRNAAEGAFVCISGSAPSARSAAEEASACISGFVPRARSAADRKSVCISGFAPGARSAVDRKFVCMGRTNDIVSSDASRT